MLLLLNSSVAYPSGLGLADRRREAVLVVVPLAAWHSRRAQETRGHDRRFRCGRYRGGPLGWDSAADVDAFLQGGSHGMQGRLSVVGAVDRHGHDT